MFPADAVTLRVAAKRLGIHPKTLARWIRAGCLPAWKRGPTAWGRKRMVVVSMSQVLALTTEPITAVKR